MLVLYNEFMDRHKRERNPLYLFLGASGLIGLSAYINAFPPDFPLTLAGFFLLLATSVGLIGAYIFRRTRHAALLAVGASLYLALRYLGLRQPIYVILLIASILAIEYLWKENG